MHRLAMLCGVHRLWKTAGLLGVYGTILWWPLGILRMEVHRTHVEIMTQSQAVSCPLQ